MERGYWQINSLIKILIFIKLNYIKTNPDF